MLHPVVIVLRYVILQVFMPGHTGDQGIHAEVVRESSERRDENIAGEFTNDLRIFATVIVLD